MFVVDTYVLIYAPIKKARTRLHEFGRGPLLFGGFSPQAGHYGVVDIQRGSDTETHIENMGACL